MEVGCILSIVWPPVPAPCLMLVTDPTLLLQVTCDFVSGELHAIGPELVLTSHTFRDQDGAALLSLAFIGVHFYYLNTL